VYMCVKACRGHKLDSGMKPVGGSTESPPPPRVQLIPAEADFLYAYSTVQGLSLCRNNNSSSCSSSSKIHSVHSLTRDGFEDSMF